MSSPPTPPSSTSSPRTSPPSTRSPASTTPPIAPPSCSTSSSAARIAAGEPELPQLLDALEKLAQQGRLKPELVSLYRDLGVEILDTRVQERVYLTVAAESRTLGDRPTAREYYRRVLDGAP